MVWWILLLVVGLIVGPFATLRAVSALRSRRSGTPSKPVASAADELDEDGKPKSSGFW